MKISRNDHGAAGSPGFTLIETLVGVAVAAVLLCVAIPALGGMVARHRLITAQLDLVAALQHARGLAITSGRPILLCPSANGLQCADDTHWERGWAMGSYRSSNADQLDGPPLRVNGRYAQLVITSTSGRKRIRFQPNGTSGGSTATFILCRAGNADGALAVTLSNMGRVSTAKASDESAAKCATGG